MANNYLPINISTKSRRCLVVGGGKVALRKVETLMEFTSDITVVAPEIFDRIEYYATKENCRIEKRPYRSPEAGEYDLVISASDDEAVNREVYDDCHAAGVLVNVADNPPLCDFIFPALLKRDAMTIAISTDGKAPFLAAHLRLILENIFPDHWSRLVRLAGDFRKKVQVRWSDNTTERFASLDRFLSADWKTMIKSKNEAELQSELDGLLEPPPPSDDDEEKIRKPDQGDEPPIHTLEFGGDD